jgi:hypothetical protein
VDQRQATHGITPRSRKGFPVGSGSPDLSQLTICRPGPRRRRAWGIGENYYVVGHTVEEQLAVALPGSGRDAAARLAGAVDPQRHPHMYAALAHIPAPHQQEHFDYGLHLIINGTRAQLRRPLSTDS